MRIGVDFDNTIAGYDRVFATLAVEAGHFERPPAGGKRAVRDAVRRGPGGDVAWQKLQALAYGRRMIEAELIPGVARFFAACRERGLPVHIVSHKSQFAPYDPCRADLRRAALGWMEANGFFDPDGFCLEPEDVYFEPTRGDKVKRIGALGVSHFIDDLEEVFNEPAFPSGVEAILFQPGDAAPRPSAVCTPFPCWGEITEHVLGPQH
jgi:hypothetical protein